jgi:hypothetical protein
MYLFAVASGTAEYLPLSPVALFGLPGRHLPTDNAHVGATQGDETVETRNRWEWECGRSRRTRKERASREEDPRDRGPNSQQWAADLLSSPSTTSFVWPVDDS